MTLRVGLVGYGVGGRLFHSPYIAASRACELVGIVARSHDAISAARDDHPRVAIRSSLADLLHSGVDAVVISTPPHTHRDLVLLAVDGGAHVIADKPFAPTALAGRELAEAADAAGVILNVFHNRRFDSDIVTAGQILASGELGRISRLDLRCDQDDAGSLDSGPQGGLLRDLGSHVVDQALLLMGEARFVSAHLVWRDLAAGRTDTGFMITIEHESGAYSHVSSSKLEHLSSRQLRLHGERGSYVSNYSDVQVEALRAGRSPGKNRSQWGFEVEQRWGTLVSDAGKRRIPSAQGDYTRFYDAFAAAIETGGPGPVPSAEGLAVLAVLDAARMSAMERRVVAI